MHKLRAGRLFRLGSRIVIATAVLAGVLTAQTRAQAAATYTVRVGLGTSYGIDVLAYGPQTLKVHRGDTVTWQFMGAHNVRFDEKPIPLIITSNVDGKTLTEINPEVLSPNGKSGDAHQHGSNSGMPGRPPSGTPTWSVVMDTAPGVYSYVCDLHPGMVGTIIVVDNGSAIPTPTEVETLGKTELDSALVQAEKTYLELLKKPTLPPTGDIVEIATSGVAGTATISRFFPEVAMITVGQSVTWKVPNGLVLPQSINFPLNGPMAPPFAPLMDSNGKPHFVLPADMLASVESGMSFPENGEARSGILAAGQSFTLKFTRPGRYAYYNGFNPMQIGLIIVQPPMRQ